MVFLIFNCFARGFVYINLDKVGKVQRHKHPDQVSEGGCDSVLIGDLGLK
jgi:hypothetical protein